MTNTSKLKKIISWCILAVIVLLVVIPIGSLFVQKYIKKTPVPMFLGYSYLIVSTGSMTGTINQGDMVIVKKTNDYKPGDVITFVSTGDKLPTTHRIIDNGAEEGTFITKGDANNTADVSPISVEQIAGEVVFVIPKLGLIFDWFIRGGGVVYVIAMIAIVIAGVYFWKLTEREENKDPTSAVQQDCLQSDSKSQN